jgi:hypothetical protein
MYLGNGAARILTNLFPTPCFDSSKIIYLASKIMEGLRKQAISAFSNVKFVPAPVEHELITLNSASDTQLTRVSLPLPNILRRFQQDLSPSPTLRLVKLHMIHPPVGKTWETPTINAAKEDIVQLWQTFKLDLSLLNLIAKGIRGFYQHHPASWDPDSNLTFIVSWYAYCVVWTYCPRLQSTSGVLFVCHQILDRSHAEQWCRALEMQVAVIQHPLCLFLSYSMQALEQAYQGSLKCQAQITHIESLTGFNPWSRDAGDDLIPASLDEISLASRNIGAVLVSLEDHLRQVNLLQQAVESLERSGFTGVLTGLPESADVMSALHALRQSMNSWELRFEYLRERAKNQLTVVGIVRFSWCLEANCMIDFQSHDALRCGLQYRNCTVHKRRQHFYESYCSNDHGVPPANILRSSLRSSIASVGRQPGHSG